MSSRTRSWKSSTTSCVSTCWSSTTPARRPSSNRAPCPRRSDTRSRRSVARSRRAPPSKTSWSTRWRPSASACGVGFWLPLLRDFRPIVEESFEPDVCESVLRHLLQDVERHRDDVGPELRGLDDVQRVADRRHEDLTVPIVLREDLDDLPDHLHAFLAHVVEATDERA